MQIWLTPEEEHLLGGIVGIVALVVIPHGRRADVLGQMIHSRAVFRIAHRQAGLDVDLLEHVDSVVDLVGGDKVAVGPVERIDDAVAIGMRQQACAACRPCPSAPTAS